MANCPNINHCPFFRDQIAAMPSVSGYLKKQFCQGNFTTYARYIVMETLDAEFVPAVMFPNEKKRAHTIIAKEL